MATTPDLAPEILAAARRRGLRIATAESCTGGMVAASLTRWPGSSEMFDCGFVSYSNAAKTRMLGVAADLIAAFGAVSEPVAEAMALGALAQSGADLAVSVTGIAGPGGSDFKPEGLVCFALAQTGHPVQTQTVAFGAIGRDAVRRAACDHAFQLLKDRLTASNGG